MKKRQKSSQKTKLICTYDHRIISVHIFGWCPHVHCKLCTITQISLRCLLWLVVKVQEKEHICLHLHQQHLTCIMHRVLYNLKLERDYVKHIKKLPSMRNRTYQLILYTLGPTHGYCVRWTVLRMYKGDLYKCRKHLQIHDTAQY